MRIKALLFALVVASLGFIIPSFVQAQTDEVGVSQGSAGAPVEMIAPDVILPPNGSEPGFLGQDHNYTVVFRGNGEAVVSARVAFTNTGDTPLSELTLRVPKVEPQELAVYQVILQPQCARYTTGGGCAQYQEPDYYQNYWYQAKYQKAQFNLDLDTLTLTLPQMVAANKSGAFFVYFRAFGYASKNAFGAYDYEFETLKTDAPIRNLRVGIATDSDLVLKNAEGEVEYRLATPALDKMETAGAPAASAALDSYVSQIGQGRLVKTASNLSPLESYKVEGAYAKNRLALYAKGLIIAALVILAFVLAVLGAIRALYKRSKKGGGGDIDRPAKSAKANSSSEMLLVAGFSFSSALMISGYTALLFFVGNTIGDLVGYRYTPIFAIFMAVISFAVYAVLLFAPTIYMGIKKGVGWGIAMLVATIVWLIVFMATALFVLFLLGVGGKNYIDPVMPLLEAR